MESNKFTFTYSAPTEDERREIESIRRQYKPESYEESKVERLRKLHSTVTGTATAVSIAVGVVGILIFGFGLSCFLEFDMPILGIAASIAGVPLIAIAYPVHKNLIKRGKEKHGEEIIKLSDELLGEEKN